MNNLKVILLMSFIFSLSCENSKTKQAEVDNSPYRMFFNELTLKNITDTILVQNKTKIFGCGTGAVMYEEELKKNGGDKFYEKYGGVLDNQEYITSFAKKNNLKILWIDRGVEGELLQLEDSVLHHNSKLEKRLLAEKTFLSFDDDPKSLDTLNITVFIDKPSEKRKYFQSFDLSKNKETWKVDKQNEKILNN